MLMARLAVLNLRTTPQVNNPLNRFLRNTRVRVWILWIRRLSCTQMKMSWAEAHTPTTQTPGRCPSRTNPVHHGCLTRVTTKTAEISLTNWPTSKAPFTMSGKASAPKAASNFSIRWSPFSVTRTSSGEARGSPRTINRFTLRQYKSLKSLSRSRKPYPSRKYLRTKWSKTKNPRSTRTPKSLSKNKKTICNSTTPCAIHPWSFPVYKSWSKTSPPTSLKFSPLWGRLVLPSKSTLSPKAPGATTAY